MTDLLNELTDMMLETPRQSDDLSCRMPWNSLFFNGAELVTLGATFFGWTGVHSLCGLFTWWPSSPPAPWYMPSSLLAAAFLTCLVSTTWLRQVDSVYSTG